MRDGEEGVKVYYRRIRFYLLSPANQGMEHWDMGIEDCGWCDG